MINNNKPPHVSTLVQAAPVDIPSPAFQSHTPPLPASNDDKSTRSIYRNSGPSADLIKRLISQQENASSLNETQDEIVPRFKQAFQESELSLETFAAHLTARAKEICPQAEDAVIHAAIEGLLGALRELSVMANKVEDDKDTRPPSSSIEEDSVSSQEPPPPKEKDEIKQVLREGLHAPSPEKAKAAPPPLEEQIFKHLMQTEYKNLVGDENGNVDDKLAERIGKDVEALIEAGNKSPGDVEKIRAKAAKKYRRLYILFAGAAEATAFSMPMALDGLLAAPNLPSHWHPVAARTIVGLTVTYPMTVLSEVIGSVRDNHLPPLGKESGVPAIDKLLPKPLRTALIVAAIGTACSFTKNTARVWLPTTLPEPLNRHLVGVLDTVIDTVGSPLAAMLASYVILRFFSPLLMPRLLAQEKAPEFVKNLNAPWTKKSTSAMLASDLKVAGNTFLRTAIAPSTLATTIFETLMVIALLSSKGETTHRFQSAHPHTPTNEMSKGEAASLGAISAVMMSVLTFFAPLIQTWTQQNVDPLFFPKRKAAPTANEQSAAPFAEEKKK